MKTNWIMYIVVVFAGAFITVDVDACCQAPFAYFTISDDLCVGWPITFNAGHSYDPDATDLTYEWDFDGDGITDATGVRVEHAYDTCGEKTVKLTVTDNDNPDCCDNKPNCSDKSDSTSTTFTVGRAEITDWTRNYVVLYCSGGGIAAELTAEGCPSGGTYQWKKEESGTGRVSLENATTPTVTVHPVAASYMPLDVYIWVEYYYPGGNYCFNYLPVMPVRKPTSTTSHMGRLYEYGQGMWRRCVRFWYHMIKDQWGSIIEEEGMPCDEHCEFVRGKDGVEKQSPGNTLNHPPNGSFPGGIAVKDVLACLATWPSTLYSQELTVGGCSTRPIYGLYYDPMGDDRKIWKGIYAW